MRNLALRPGALALGALLAAAACEADRQAGLAPPSEPVPGARMVRLPVEDVALRGEAPVVYTLSGDDAGGAPGPLGDVADVAFDAAGRLYVLDAVNTRVVVFDTTGRFVRAFARAGGGPGELRAPSAVAVTSDGHVLVSDPGRQGYVRFDTSGAYADMIPMPPGGAFGTETRADSRGGWLGVAADPPQETRLSAGPAVGTARREQDAAVIARMRPGAPRLDTVYRAARTWDEEKRTARTGEREFRTTSTGAPRFAPGVHWDVLPGGGVAVAGEAAYRVVVTGPDGVPRAVLDRPFPLRRVTSADQRRERERVRNLLTSGGFQATTNGRPASVRLPREMVEAQVEALRFADVWPNVRGLRATPRGTLWISRTGASLDRPGPVDLVSASGAYLGSTRLPLPEAFGAGGLAAFVERDGDGRGRVVVRRLPADWR